MNVWFLLIKIAPNQRKHRLIIAHSGGRVLLYLHVCSRTDPAPLLTSLDKQREALIG
jgi:hypothetical protein